MHRTGLFGMFSAILMLSLQAFVPLTPWSVFLPNSNASLFLNSLHTLPLTPQILLPKRNLIIPRTNRQHIPAQTPTDPPEHNLELDHLAVPHPRLARIARPDPHRLVLARGRDVTLLQHRGRPCYVAHPVRVAG